MAEELKACPCGNPAELVKRGGGYTVNCTWHPIREALGECKPCQFDGCSTDMFDTAEMAIKVWNMPRPLEDALQAQINKMIEEIDRASEIWIKVGQKCDALQAKLDIAREALNKLPQLKSDNIQTLRGMITLYCHEALEKTE